MCTTTPCQSQQIVELGLMVCCVLFLVCFKASSDYNLSLFRQGHGVPELQLLQSILMPTSELFVGSIYPAFESSWGSPPPGNLLRVTYSTQFQQLPNIHLKQQVKEQTASSVLFVYTSIFHQPFKPLEQKQQHLNKVYQLQFKTAMPHASVVKLEDKLSNSLLHIAVAARNFRQKIKGQLQTS